MPPDPSLDHLEKTFVEAYRKELDQEENVWRSLPFFAATLAMQVAALAQVRDWLAATAGWASWAAALVLVLAAAATLSALFFLAWSILPYEFRYVAREPDLLRYAEAVRARAEADGAGPAAASEVAHTALRATLVEQYALSTDHNRAVNQRRASRRNRAGLATLCSVLLFVVLVALAVVSTVTPPPAARSPAAPHAAVAAPPDEAARPGAAQPAAAGSPAAGPARDAPGSPGDGPGAGGPGSAGRRTGLDAAIPAAPIAGPGRSGNPGEPASDAAGPSRAGDGQGARPADPSPGRWRQPGPAADQPRATPAHGGAP